MFDNLYIWFALKSKILEDTRRLKSWTHCFAPWVPAIPEAKARESLKPKSSKEKSRLSTVYMGGGV